MSDAADAAAAAGYGWLADHFTDTPKVIPPPEPAAAPVEEPEPAPEPEPEAKVEEPEVEEKPKPPTRGRKTTPKQ